MGVCRVSSAATLVDACVHGLACASELPQQNFLDHPPAPQSRSQFWSGRCTSDEPVVVPILCRDSIDLAYSAATCLSCAVPLPSAASPSVQHVGCLTHSAAIAASLCRSCGQAANSMRSMGASASAVIAPALAPEVPVRGWVFGFPVSGLGPAGLGQHASHDWCCACCHGQLPSPFPSSGPSILPICPLCLASDVPSSRVRQAALVNPYVPSGEPVHIVFTFSVPAERPLCKSVAGRLGTRALPWLRFDDCSGAVRGFHFPALTRVLSLLRRARTPICRFPVSLAVQRQRAHSWASSLTLVWLAAVSRPLLLRVSGRPASFIRRACESTLQDLTRSWQRRCMTVVSFVPVVCVTGRGSVLLLGRV